IVACSRKRRKTWAECVGARRSPPKPIGKSSGASVVSPAATAHWDATALPKSVRIWRAADRDSVSRRRSGQSRARIERHDPLHLFVDSTRFRRLRRRQNNLQQNVLVSGG